MKEEGYKDLSTISIAAPLDEVVAYLGSDDFKTKMGASVAGKLVVKVTPITSQEFKVWLGVWGEGSAVSARVVASSGRETRLTFWISIKGIIVVAVIFAPFCGLGLLLGYSAYVKAKGGSGRDSSKSVVHTLAPPEDRPGSSGKGVLATEGPRAPVRRGPPVVAAGLGR